MPWHFWVTNGCVFGDHAWCSDAFPFSARSVFAETERLAPGIPLVQG